MVTGWGSGAAAPRAWSPWAALRRHPDIWVHRCRLDEGTGWWCPAERVILLDDRLGRREARCALAHELAHVELGHAGLPDVAGSRRLAHRVEAAADAWAATRLVPLDSLARALAVHPDDAEAAAAELDVTAQVLHDRVGRLGPRERALLGEGPGPTG